MKFLILSLLLIFPSMALSANSKNAELPTIQHGPLHLTSAQLSSLVPALAFGQGNQFISNLETIEENPYKNKTTSIRGESTRKKRLILYGKIK